MRARRAGAVAATAVFLLAAVSACATEVRVDPTPVVVGEPAPSADVDPGSLPEPLAHLKVASVGWDTAPLERDGIFLGMRTGDGHDSPLQFVAADGAGTVLWRADRPPACTNFTFSTAGDRTIVVLLNATTTEEALAGVNATAYDLATGRRVWGPVDVPGPLMGPGLVFAAPGPAAALGQTGPRVALDPATGDVLASERDIPGTTIVGEYDGDVLTAADGRLRAAGADGRTRWSRPQGELGIPSVGAVAAVPAATPPAGTAIVGADGADTGTLIDLDGTVLATDVQDARRDPASGTMVTRSGSTVSGYPTHGDPWTRTLDGDVELAGVGGVLAYLEVDGAVQVLNATTGRDASAYSADRTGPVAIPETFGADGGAAVRLDEHYLVTNRPTGD